MNTKYYSELLKNYNPGVLLTAGLKEIHRKIWRELIRGSYAQNYEDLIINKLIKKERGKYVEIGGYHPTRLSNTYYFYKKGWRGIVAEPNPEVKGLFKKIRPRDKFINAGVSDKKRLMDYYEFFIPALNTFSKVEAEINYKNGHKLKKVIKIKTIEIKEIINDDIDFLSIDTEGFDDLILKNWPWQKCRPKVICVETNKHQISKLMRSEGYKLFYKNNNNSIFLSER